MKSNKGVTLIALVITIIVLLILAGVSISLVVGDSGVFTQAKDASTKSTKADLREALDRAIASALGKYTSTTDFTSGRLTFFQWLQKGGSNNTVSNVLEESGYVINCTNGTNEITGTIKATNTTKGYSFNIVGGEEKLTVSVGGHITDNTTNTEKIN